MSIISFQYFLGFRPLLISKVMNLMCTLLHALSGINTLVFKLKTYALQGCKVFSHTVSSSSGNILFLNHLLVLNWHPLEVPILGQAEFVEIEKNKAYKCGLLFGNHFGGEMEIWDLYIPSPHSRIDHNASRYCT